ncbi:MAG: phage holin, LLH family [Candidatus Margulisiibacteriota bacterium]
MDILGAVGNVFGGVGKQVVIWTIGGAISLFVVNEIRKFLNEIKDHIIRKVKGEVANIEDENLREAARHVVRYVAGRFPDISGDAKLQMAIKQLQDITPDILVSDDKLKVLIESAYSDFKQELKSV